MIYIYIPVRVCLWQVVYDDICEIASQSRPWCFSETRLEAAEAQQSQITQFSNSVSASLRDLSAIQWSVMREAPETNVTVPGLGRPPKPKCRPRHIQTDIGCTPGSLIPVVYELVRQLQSRSRTKLW